LKARRNYVLLLMLDELQKCSEQIMRALFRSVSISINSAHKQ
jgi:hypothetical protein